MEQAKQDYRGLYEQIVKSEWFKKAYHNKSLGECPIVVEELEESEDERIRKWLIKTLKGLCNSPVEIDGSYEMMLPAIAWLEKQKEPKDKGEISDGYHTFNELYFYRMLYNAAFFNLLPKEWVHKSKKHRDGEECFGGGWFIVMANLPTGQISNHYELKDWDLFQIPEKEVADEWDGHTPQEAAERLHKYLLEKQKEQKPDSTEDMPYITDEHFYEREPADSFKYKLAEYMTKCCTKKEGPYGYEYGLSAETILKMAEEELLKRGVVQKPMEWSEEDKENLLCVCGLLKHYLSADYKGSKYWDDAQVNEWIEWAKNLPNRFQLQPKQEWSEEDEKVYEYLKGGFEYATNNPELLSSRLSGKNDATIQDYKNFIDKLKFLRPQPKQELSEGDKKILDNVSQILIGLNYQELAKNYKQTIEKLWKLSER